MDVCDGLGQKHSHPWRIPEWASPSFSIGDRIADRPAPRQLLNSHGVKIDFQRHLKRAYAELLNLGTKKTAELANWRKRKSNARRKNGSNRRSRCTRTVEASAIQLSSHTPLSAGAKPQPLLLFERTISSIFITVPTFHELADPAAATSSPCLK